MKGFLIVMALLVGGGITLLTQYEKIGQWYMEKVEAEEGGKAPNNQAFETLKYQDRAAFAAKYKPTLDKRVKLAKFADLIGSTDFFVATVLQTRELYLASSLAGDKGFGDLLIALGEHYEGEHQEVQAYELYKELLANFPEHPKFKRIEAAANRLRIKHGMS